MGTACPIRRRRTMKSGPRRSRVRGRQVATLLVAGRGGRRRYMLRIRSSDVRMIRHAVGLTVNVRGWREEIVEDRYTVQCEHYIGDRDQGKCGNTSENDVGWVPHGPQLRC